MHNWCTYSDFFSVCNLIRSSTCPLVLTIFKQTQATKCIIDTYTYFVFFSESLRNIFHRLLAGLAVFDTVFLIISMIDSFRRHFRFHQLYVYGWGFSMKRDWLTWFRLWFLMFCSSHFLFLVLGYFRQRSYKNTKILRNLC